MTIKKQFRFLIAFIIAIPIFCTLFVITETYIHSTKRYLIKGYKEAEQIEEEQSDYADAIKIVKLIPPEVQSCLIDLDSADVVISTMPELQHIDSVDQIWLILSDSTDDFFYQFTSPATVKKTLLITRISRVKPKLTPAEKIIYNMILFLFIAIIGSIFYIYYISKTISNSIVEIKNQTKEIANGNLNKEIKTKAKISNQNEIISILESLEKMRQALIEAEKRKSIFIMGISHDLRTPIAIIKGYTEALTDNVIESKEDINNALLLIETKTNQLECMVNDLINFTKLNSFELREQLTVESITDLIKIFAKECSISGNVFKRDIITKIDLPNDIKIPFNKKLILRVLENLFGNAMRYTNDGDRITISSYVKDNELLLQIKDTGIGIKKDDLLHIFDLFYKSSNSRQGESMGIGLSVVKNVLDAHGWDIDVVSELGNGTIFTIYIPIKDSI